MYVESGVDLSDALARINRFRERFGMKPLPTLRNGVRGTGEYRDCLLGANLDHRQVLAAHATANDPVLFCLEREFEHGLLPELEVR